MARSLFRRGSILTIDDVYHRVVEIVGERFQLRAARDGALHEYSSQQLLSLYERARLKITALEDFPAEGGERLSQIPIERSLSDFPSRCESEPFASGSTSLQSVRTDGLGLVERFCVNHFASVLSRSNQERSRQGLQALRLAPAMGVGPLRCSCPYRQMGTSGPAAAH